MSGIATAIGPFLGGWLIDTVSWRLAFFVNVPLAIAVAIAARRVPETKSYAVGRLDFGGALAASAGLALATYGLIERHRPLGVVGVVVLGFFLISYSRLVGKSFLFSCRSRLSPFL